MKLLLTGFLLLAGFAISAQKKTAQKEEALTWHTDLLKAHELSQKTKKPIFAMFTGSDWCIWCKKLQADVFAKPDFIKWAGKNVILLEVDFPRFKQLSPELQTQNATLAQALPVPGYPTVWMFFLTKEKDKTNYNISTLGSPGYPQGAEPGKEEVKFIDDADKVFKDYQAKKP